MHGAGAGARITYGEQYQDSVEVWAREEYERGCGRRRASGTDPMAISRYWTARHRKIKADPAAWLKLIAKKCWLTLGTLKFQTRVFPSCKGILVAAAFAGALGGYLADLRTGRIWLAARHGNRDALLVLMIYAALYSRQRRVLHL